MNILVPTDFSELSKIAVQYAVKMAKKLDAKIIIFHTVYIDAHSKAQVSVKSEHIMDVMANNAKKKLEQLINELKIKNKNGHQITSKISKGYPLEELIEKFAKNNPIDLIVMGTKGASGLKKVLLGSNAVGVITNSSIPVITVPEHSRFRPIKHILYASDLFDSDTQIKTLIPFALLFNATIHLLHIIPLDSKNKMDKTKIKKDIIQKNKYPKIVVHLSKNDDVIAGIDKYIADVNADMLVMFTQELSFFEKLFGKSVTREMAFHSQIPLLSIKKQFNF